MLMDGGLAMRGACNSTFARKLQSDVAHSRPSDLCMPACMDGDVAFGRRTRYLIWAGINKHVINNSCHTVRTVCHCLTRSEGHRQFTNLAHGGTARGDAVMIWTSFVIMRVPNCSAKPKSSIDTAFWLCMAYYFATFHCQPILERDDDL